MVDRCSLLFSDLCSQNITNLSFLCGKLCTVSGQLSGCNQSTLRSRKARGGRSKRGAWKISQDEINMGGVKFGLTMHQ